jgi:hypothetical protein
VAVVSAGAAIMAGAATRVAVEAIAVVEAIAAEAATQPAVEAIVVAAATAVDIAEAAACHPYRAADRPDDGAVTAALAIARTQVQMG